MVVGSGSDLSEEPAVQDVEPVTLDFVSFLIVLPGPSITARGGGRRRPRCGRRRWRSRRFNARIASFEFLPSACLRS